MAADETLVQSAARGVASLRFYGWSEPTVSLGYFQPSAVRLLDSVLISLAWVRRPSGGATLVHHHELTYCLAMPPGPPWQGGESWMPRMHRVIARALGDLGRAGSLESVQVATTRHDNALCFHQFTPGDLLSAGKKVVGSAQRKYRQALMQHGSILLCQSDFTPSLPGIRELTGITLTATQIALATADAFRRETGWRLEAEPWTDAERANIQELAKEKYGAAEWNEKR